MELNRMTGRRFSSPLKLSVVIIVAALAGVGLWVASGAGLQPDGRDGSSAAAMQESEEDGTLGRGALGIAQAIADHFGVNQQEVIDLHARGAGFGALVKIYAVAEIRGVSADSLIDQLPLDLDGDIDVDVLIAGLTDGERAAFHALGLRGVGHIKNASAHCPPGLAKQDRC